MLAAGVAKHYPLNVIARKIYIEELNNSGLDDEEISKIISKMALPHNRYTSFFGEGKVSFEYGGFDKYLNDLGV